MYQGFAAAIRPKINNPSGEATMSQIHWTKQVSADFNTAADWTGGVVPGSKDDAILDAAGTAAYTVTASTNEVVNSIQTGATATLSVTVSNGSGGFFANGGTGAGANAGVIAIANNSNFIAGGTVDNVGEITVNSGGNVTSFQVEAAGMTLSGGGKVILGDSSQNQIFGDTATATLTNVDNTISGAGRIGNGQTSIAGAGGLALTNDAKGVINAVGANTLVLNTGLNVVVNNGLLEGSGVGGLTIQGATVNDSAGGTLQANTNSNVSLQSADIMGGFLKTVGTGSIQTIDFYSQLDGTTSAVTNTGALNILNNTSLTIQGAIANTGGKINIDSGGNTTSLIVGVKNATITGGTVTLSNTSPNQIVGTLSGPRGGQSVTTLTNAAVISGAGSIGSDLILINNDIIDANDTTALIVSTGAAGVAGSNVITNNLTLESTNTNKAISEGGLLLRSVTIDNTAKVGRILADGLHTHVDLQSADIVGGTLESLVGGVIDTVDMGTVLDGTSATNHVEIVGLLTITNNTAVTLEGEIIDAAASGIALDSGGNVTSVIVGAKNAELAGGAITMSDASPNQIVGTLSGAINHQTVSTFTSKGTITGAGSVGANLVLINDSTIDATGGNALIIATGAASVAGSNKVTNTSLLESTNPGKLSTVGGLSLRHVTISNSAAGKIYANGLHTHVDLQSATIVGGVLATALTGVIDTVDTGSVLQALTNDGEVLINNNTALTVTGAIKNVTTGSIILNSQGNYTDLIIGGTGATLSGGGVVTLVDGPNNRIYGATSSALLANVDNVISGAGQFGAGQLTLDNELKGVIDAIGNNALVLNTSGKVVTNDGLLEATGAGGLTIQSTMVNDNADGVIQANDGSQVTLQSATIIGGTLKLGGAGSGFFHTVDSGSVFDGTTAAGAVNNTGLVNIDNNTALTLQGSIANTGTIALNSTGNYTSLVIDLTNVTLNGGGALSLSTIGTNLIYGSTAGSTLTNVDNTITGGGQLGNGKLTLINQASGVIQAFGGAALVINTGSSVMTNSGLIEAGDASGDAGTLNIVGTTINESTGGVILANDNSTVNLIDATLVGGTLQAPGIGVFQTGDTLSVLDGLTSAVNNQGSINILNNTALTIQGTINNTGAIAITGGGNDSDLIVDVTGATLTGGGTLDLGNNANDRVYGVTAASVLTNVNLTITGGGQLGASQLTLVNQAKGVIDGDVGTTMVLNTGANTINNAGLIEATAGGEVLIDSALANTGTVEANGGTMVVSAAMSGAGKAVIASGELEFTLAGVAQNVTFTGPDGTLRLDNSQTYTGKVSGFTTVTGTTFDLSDIGFVSSSEAKFSGTASGGVLTVSDGAHTAHITMVGDYLGSSFVASADGHGGVTISDPPAGLSMAPGGHRFVAAMAAMGAAGAATALAPHQPAAATSLMLLASGGRQG
jgi:hypothetical protein